MSQALTSASLPLLPSFRRQQLLLEFASLKRHCPDGLYLTPNPTDPACWTGVYFVREGPYSSAILRFEILFPPSYPEAPPLVIFSSEIFHPLLVPLTTYTFSPGAEDPFATYSASETERLPPGALSLRYGFPQWFRKAERGREDMSSKDGIVETITENEPIQVEENSLETSAQHMAQPKHEPITIGLLRYIKAAFEDPDNLDSLPLDATGNQNAWHAWRTHRGLPKQRARPDNPSNTTSNRVGASPQNPADWNWDGVWEARVQNGINESISDALLFSSKNIRGGPSSTDSIRFTKLDDEKLASVQDDMLKMHGFF